MKKIFALLLAVMLMAGLVACGEKEAPATTPATTTAPAATEEATEPATEEATEPATEEITEPVEDTTGAAEETTPAEMTASVEILANIWGKYAEDEKFFAMGGDMNNMVDGAPGQVDVTDVDFLGFTLLVPAEQTANLADAASLVHGMNGNTFTCGVYELVEGADAAAFTEAMKAALKGNQWMCGMPEEMVLVTVDANHVLVAYGLNDAMGPFKTHLAEAYPDATIVAEPVIE